MWLSGLCTGLQTKRLLVRFPVRACAWVVARSPVGGMGEITSQCFSHTRIFLSPSLPLTLKTNLKKILKALPSLFKEQNQTHSLFNQSSWHHLTGHPQGLPNSPTWARSLHSPPSKHSVLLNSCIHGEDHFSKTFEFTLVVLVRTQNANSVLLILFCQKLEVLG